MRGLVLVRLLVSVLALLGEPLLVIRTLILGAVVWICDMTFGSDLCLPHAGTIMRTSFRSMV